MQTIERPVSRRGTALSEKDYRIFFSAQLISACGTFLQGTALSWLVYDLTHSGTKTTIISALNILPMAIAAPLGGLALEFFGKRNVLYVTQVVAMLLAFLLAVLTFYGEISFLGIAILSGCNGLVTVFDAPGRASFMTDLIKNPKHLRSGVGLNSSMMTASQAVGPMFAGFLLMFVSPGATFLINGITFIPAIIALGVVEPVVHVKTESELKSEEKKEGPLEMILNGLKWVASHKDILFLIALSFFTGFLVRSYPSILPKMADVLYHKTGREGVKLFSYLLAATGVGAACAGLLITYGPQNISHKRLIRTGLVLTSLSLPGLGFLSSATGISILSSLGWGLPQNLCLALGLLFVNGFGFTIVVSVGSAIIQAKATSKMRGRAVSIFYWGLSIGLALGSMLIGWLTDHVGLSQATYSYGIGVTVVAIIAMVFIGHIQEETPAPAQTTA